MTFYTAIFPLTFPPQARFYLMSQKSPHRISWIYNWKCWLEEVDRFLLPDGMWSFFYISKCCLLFVWNKCLDMLTVWPDAPENCHLNVKKLPKTWHFFSKKLPKIFILSKNVNFWHFFEKKCQVFLQFFDIQMAIFRRVMLGC